MEKVNNFSEVVDVNREKASKLWDSFKQKIYYENRFFIEHTLLEMLANYIKDHTINVPSGHIYYRARIIDENALKDHQLGVYKSEGIEKALTKFTQKDNLFRGLSKQGSFVPLDCSKIRDGRANPKFIRYLYVAEDAVTALFEVRPLIYDSVNLAEIVVNSDLTIANMEIDKYYLFNSGGSVLEWLIFNIQDSFSNPTNNPDDYLVSQVISEYIKKLGYDGIRFNSSLHRNGINVTIFNYDKCEALSSQEMKIEQIKLSARVKSLSWGRKGTISRIVDNAIEYIE